MTFTPKYTITPKIMNALAAIEASKQAIVDLPITTRMIASLRETARIASTHHSTAIEGNALNLKEVRDVLKDNTHFPHRTKDEQEVKNYYSALDLVDGLARHKAPLQESDIQHIHGMAFNGLSKPTPYRDAQNVIRNGKLVVYIPPKAEEVPSLMGDLVTWINLSIQKELPIPIIAAFAHYQFATVHPYYDGNGRTARLLVTLILHKYGYGLKGIYSLEEYYAQNLEAYYTALTVGEDEDYYDGKRAQADLTSFLEYFVVGMADAFLKIKAQASQAQNTGSMDHSPLLRDLSSQQKLILDFFRTSKEITVKDIAAFFCVSNRQARNLCQKWIESDFIEISNPAPKTRSYKLTSKYESLVLASL